MLKMYYVTYYGNSTYFGLMTDLDEFCQNHPELESLTAEELIRLDLAKIGDRITTKDLVVEICNENDPRLISSF